MVEFKSVALTDRELLTSYIYPGHRRDNNLSFANLCYWQFLTCSSFAILDNQLVLRFCFPDEKTVYTLPGGEKEGEFRDPEIGSSGDGRKYSIISVWECSRYD